MIKDITNEIVTYMNFCGGIEDRKTDYPADILIRTIFRPKYYKYLEETLNEHKPEQRKFMFLIYKQIIPYICSILPNTIEVLYRDDKYDPNIYLQKDFKEIGRINLAKYRFEYSESDEIQEKRKALAEIKKQADGLDWQLQAEMSSSDINTLFGRKRKIRQRDAYIAELGAQLEQFRQEQSNGEAELEALIAQDEEKVSLIRTISNSLYNNLKIPTQIVEEESFNV